MFKKLICLAAVVLMLAIGCTQQQRARNFGGTTKIELSRGQKLVVATWKDHDLWYLVRPMRSGEQPEIYEFLESSSFGLLQGKVIFIENK